MADKFKFIASTMSASVEYPLYSKAPEGAKDYVPTVLKRVLIQGGANVALGRNLITSAGIVTKITEDDLALLEANDVFKVHKANGFIQILDTKPEDAEAVAADMTTRDESAPLTDNDFEEKSENDPEKLTVHSVGTTTGKRK